MNALGGVRTTSEDFDVRRPTVAFELGEGTRHLTATSVPHADESQVDRIAIVHAWGGEVGYD